MNLNDFISSRRTRWGRLTALLDRLEGGLQPPLNRNESEELFALYRLVSSDLNLMQTAGGSAGVRDYLERLVARAYQGLAPQPKNSIWKGWWRLLRHDFPASARRQWAVLFFAAAVMFSGTLFGYIATSVRPSVAVSIVPGEFWRQKPAQRVEKRYQAQSLPGFSYRPGENLLFTVYLFTHNILVGVGCFALAALYGVFTVAMLFFNGLILGSLAQRYIADGVGTYLFAWVGPHGSFELPAICVASAAGLIISRAQWTRGGRWGSVMGAIRAQRRDMINLLLGSAHMFVVAGIFEGGFSQLTSAIIPYWLKIMVAILLFLTLTLYLFFIPVDAAPVSTSPLEAMEMESAAAPAALRQTPQRATPLAAPAPPLATPRPTPAAAPLPAPTMRKATP